MLLVAAMPRFDDGRQLIQSISGHHQVKQIYGGEVKVRDLLQIQIYTYNISRSWIKQRIRRDMRWKPAWRKKHRAATMLLDAPACKTCTKSSVNFNIDIDIKAKTCTRMQPTCWKAAAQARIAWRFISAAVSGIESSIYGRIWILSCARRRTFTYVRVHVVVFSAVGHVRHTLRAKCKSTDADDLNGRVSVQALAMQGSFSCSRQPDSVNANCYILRIQVVSFNYSTVSIGLPTPE